MLSYCGSVMLGVHARPEMPAPSDPVGNEPLSCLMLRQGADPRDANEAPGYNARGNRHLPWPRTARVNDRHPPCRRETAAENRRPLQGQRPRILVQSIYNRCLKRGIAAAQ
jgi:hypothetical protein